MPYNIQNHHYSNTCSIGITLFPKQQEGAEDLLREADTAMYRAKDMGRNRIRFMKRPCRPMQERLALEQDLKKPAPKASWPCSCSRKWMRAAQWWAASC